MNYEVGDRLIYKTYNRNGKIMRFGKNAPEMREIIRVLENTKGINIIEWKSENSQGACIVSLWEEWRRGVNENKRRGVVAVHYD